MDDPRQIRSYGVVFSLERRLHRIDRFRIPLPYGLPLRSVGYGAVILLAVLLAGRLPGIGQAVAGLPAPVRFAVLPTVGAVLLTQLRVDGRHAGAAGVAFVVFLVAPRHLAAWRHERWGQVVWLADFTIAPGAEGSVIRQGTITGPCEVLLDADVTPRRRRRTTRIRRRDLIRPGSTSIALHAHDRLVIR